MFRIVCSINNVTARFEPQHPLATPHDESDQSKSADQRDPCLRPKPRRKCLGPRDHRIDALAKAIFARSQRSFVLPRKDQRFFGWHGHNAVIGLLDRKVAAIGIVGGHRWSNKQQAAHSKNAQTSEPGPHHRPHIRPPRHAVNSNDEP
jgi:hypothetical protein